MVNRKAVQRGQRWPRAQLNVATTAAISYCMMRGPGGVNVDGVNVLHDPRKRLFVGKTRGTCQNNQEVGAAAGAAPDRSRPS